MFGASEDETYTVGEDTTAIEVDHDQLDTEIVALSLPGYAGLVAADETITVVVDPLSGPQKTSLDDAMRSHEPAPNTYSGRELLFGEGLAADRPATGDKIGSRYWVIDPGTGGVKRYDYWDKETETWIENAATGPGVVPDASESVKGIIEIADTGEAQGGTDDLRAVTPLKLAQAIVAVQTVTTSPVTLVSDVWRRVVLVDCSTGGRTLNLPTAVGATGRAIVVKKISGVPANAVSIQASGAEKIDGTASQELRTSQESIEIISDGSHWHIIG